MNSEHLNALSKCLKDAISNSTDKVKPEETIKTLFKHAVARMFEEAMIATGRSQRMEYDAIVETKNALIYLFRNTELGEHQKSIEWYEDLFDATVQEILNFASHNHKGSDIITLDNSREFSINPARLVDN